MELVWRVFVYGTLMTGMAAHAKIAPYVLAVQPAVVAGRLVHLAAGYPMLLPGAEPVQGELLLLQPRREALAVMDEWEDYHGPGSDNGYERELCQVDAAEGEVEAWVYRCPENKVKWAEGCGTPVQDGNWRLFLYGHLQGAGEKI